MFKQKGRGKLIFLLILVFTWLSLPLFVNSPYYLHLLIMAGINIALAMTFALQLRTGLVNMAIAAFWAVGAYTSALLVMRLELSFWLSLPISTLVTAIIALGIGYFLVRTAGFGFIILTAVSSNIYVAACDNRKH